MIRREPEPQACDLCGGTRQRVLFLRGRGGERLCNVVCEDCGLVFVRRSDLASTAEQYESGKFSLLARGGSRPDAGKIVSCERSALQRIRTLVQSGHLSPQPGSAVEIGCGFGSFLHLLRGTGWEVQGVEPDPDYARFGESHYQVPIKAARYEGWIPARSYLLACAFHVIEHVVSPRAFLRKVFEELRPGGTVYLEVPCIDRPYGGDLENFFWSVHLFSFSKNTLCGLLLETGFTVAATGWHGDFLWVMGRKPEEATQAMPRRPYDDSRLVYRRVHGAYHQHLVTRLRNTPSFRLATKCRTAAPLILHDPVDLIRKGRRALGRLIRGPDARMKVAPGAIVHVCLHSVENAGDIMLVGAVRKAIDGTGPRAWHAQHLWEPVTREHIQAWNENARAVVVGGGGLFLQDTNPNQTSGWQWTCPVELLREIAVPLVVFAVGYNRFRGQDDFDPIFTRHLSELVRRAAFFGLRNRGSMTSIARYLPDDLAAKMTVQPCPTTVIRHLYPEWVNETRQTSGKVLGINVAFDRSRLRFQGREDQILSALARAARSAERQGWRIQLLLHLPQDANILPWLWREGVGVEEVNLAGASERDIVRAYGQVDLALGMRGHAQMIPFGVGTPIVSLISHDKLQWFLDDIGHPDWGVDLLAPDLRGRLEALIEDVGANLDERRAQVRVAGDRVWEITKNNLRLLTRLWGEAR